MLRSWHLCIVLLALTGLLAEGESTITTSNIDGAVRLADQNKATNRFLRIHKEAVDDNEERGILSDAVGAVSNTVNTARLNWDIQKWLKNNLKADDVFDKLQLNLAKDKLFDNPHWKPFTEYVAKLDKSDAEGSTVTALMRIYNNIELSTMLANAQKVPSMKAEAMKWETARLNFWLKRKSKPDEIFDIMKLNKASDDLFDSPQFVTWTTYLKKFNEKYSEQEILQPNMVGTLTKSYGEVGLMKMLVSAENANSPGATKVKNEVLQSWMEYTVAPNQAFKKLKLNKEGDNLLSSPLLSTWVEYLNIFNKGFPAKKTTMTATFTKTYGDEGLAKMLETAKANPSTKELATNLQIAQFKQWMIDGKSPRNILEDVLKLDSNTFLVDDVSGDIWRLYNKAIRISTLDGESTTSPSDAQRATRLPTFDQVSIINRLLRSRTTVTENDKEERALSDLLSAAQLKWWLNTKTNVNDVFKNLHLNLAKDNLFENSHWKAFTEYAVKLDKSDADESIVTALMRAYENVGLTKMLAAAKNTPNTKAEAMKWEAARLNYWLSKKTEPDKIFTILKLNKATDDLFDSPQFSTWTTYLKMFNEKYPAGRRKLPPTLVDTFSNSYGQVEFMKMLASADKANSAGATKVKNDIFQGWMDFAITPSKAYNILKLDEEGDKILSSPLLSTWVEYLSRYNKEFPDDKATMTAIFTKHYGDEGWAKMLETAKANLSTKELATNLQNAQFSQWMVDRKTPKNILEDVLKLDSNAFLVGDLRGDIWRLYNTAYAKNNLDAGFAFQP
ncbi:RxLR effector protein [Phytophthora megakarya]|uniref:RxLR effector protein n=1 Tax=Phytophthora megakarya TaxID=4795 RepID=A0A225W1W0_9STRA|nr:RxLR effector protein [Phytophthora megakarya]